jgi:hypothetical protein
MKRVIGWVEDMTDRPLGWLTSDNHDVLVAAVFTAVLLVMVVIASILSLSDVI